MCYGKDQDSVQAMNREIHRMIPDGISLKDAVFQAEEEMKERTIIPRYVKTSFRGFRQEVLLPQRQIRDGGTLENKSNFIVMKRDRKGIAIGHHSQEDQQNEKI